jgi:hypothetical protein
MIENHLISALHKAIEINDNANIKDILIAINELNPSSTSIEKSKLGNIISSLRKKFLSSEVDLEKEIATLCKTILEKWKKIFHLVRSSSVKNDPREAIAAQEYFNNTISSLPEPRLKVCTTPQFYFIFVLIQFCSRYLTC